MAYMSAKDIYHETVRIALEKDGWTITSDPLVLTFTEILDSRKAQSLQS